MAENEVKGHFKPGDIVALEVNIRCPGGYTPDLLNYGLSTNLYQMFADVVCFGKSDEPVGPHWYAACASRRYNNQYFFTEEDILRTYKNEIVNVGDYPLVLSDLMGNRFYMARFQNEKDVLLFKEYVTRSPNVSYREGEKINHLGGEDKRMLDDRKREKGGDELTICDKHVDGA